MHFINKDKIISATIIKPNKHNWLTDHGWQISFHVGYIDGLPDCIVVDKGSGAECIALANHLGLELI